MSVASAQLHTIPEIASMLADQAEAVVRHLLPNGRLEHHEWCVGSIHGEPGDSFKVHLVGEKVGWWKDFALPGDKGGGDLVELWHKVRNVDKSTALKEIREFLGLNRRLHVAPRNQPAERSLQAPAVAGKPISREYHQTLRSNLLKNDAALAYLKGISRGLDDNTIKHFGLGLSGEYKLSDGTVTSKAIVAPMRLPASGGWLSKTAYITIPGLTMNPRDTNGWMKGRPQTYYSDQIHKQTILFVCEGLKDVWRHWRALAEHKLLDRILLVSSTHGSAIPEEWKHPSFWAKWETVYLGQDNDEAGDILAERVLEIVGREARRIRVPDEIGKDWTDFWQNGGTLERFIALLDGAPVASGAAIEKVDDPHRSLPKVGRFSYKPVDINGAYVNGFLYYPTETRVVKLDEETGVPLELRETIVVRSDKTTHRAIYAPAPPGTPLNKRVLKLTDGTIIEKEPKASNLGSWDFESIHDYLNGKAKVRPLKVILDDLERALTQSIWLPYEEDYTVLALTALVTYTQCVFESVPLLLLNGPHGTGKTQTGNIMAKLCANGTVVGQVSAASAARLIDETRGFVVIDDIEAIAAKAGKDIQIGEYVQALKVSYNKHTAVKYWTDIKTMKTERLDFFGVKMLSNTLGADPILGSRMLRIQTRMMPSGMKSNVRDFTVEEMVSLVQLRHELHTWAFENVREVERVYREVYANKSDRQTEIAAPLRTMAKLVGNLEVTTKLEAALARQHTQTSVQEDDPIETMKEAVRNLIRQGYDTVTVTHLRLEMRALLDAHYGMSSTTEIPEWDRPEWLGRQLRSNDLVADVDLGRARVYGKNLRLVRFSSWILDEVKATHDAAGTPITSMGRKPQEFCKGCDSCAYKMTGCELQVLRARAEHQRRQPMTH